MRTLGLRRGGRARGSWRSSRACAPSSTRFCAGVNAAAADRPLPIEFQLLRLAFEPFTPADALTLTKLLSFGLSTNWERELLRAEMTRELGAELAARLDPAIRAAIPVVLTPGATGTATGWASSIRSRRSATRSG